MESETVFEFLRISFRLAFAYILRGFPVQELISTHLAVNSKQFLIACKINSICSVLQILPMKVSLLSSQKYHFDAFFLNKKSSDAFIIMQISLRLFMPMRISIMKQPYASPA
jgi:hypothetical protein